MLKSSLHALARRPAALVAEWMRARKERAEKARLLGSMSSEADRLMAETAHAPTPADVVLRMGCNSRRMMRRLGVRAAPNLRDGALLADIDRSCKSCPDWRLCARWLDAGTNDKAYLGFCPNVGRFASLSE